MGTRLCNNVEKAFRSKEQPRSSPKIIQPSPSVYTGLHTCPHQEVEIIIFSFQAIRPNSPSPQSSQGPQCVFEFYSDWRKRRHKAQRTGLRHVSHLKRPKTNSLEVQGALSFQEVQGPPWARPRREDTPQRMSSSLSWQRWTAAHGRLSDKPQSRVELGGWVPVEQGLHHYHFHHWKCLNYRTCNPEYSRQDMPEQWLPWEKMQWADEAITDSLAQVDVHIIKMEQILTADVNKSSLVFVYSWVTIRKGALLTGGPGGPGKPSGPASPWTPLIPSGPEPPAGPAGPRFPRLPWGPCSPWSPTWQEN